MKNASAPRLYTRLADNAMRLDIRSRLAAIWRAMMKSSKVPPIRMPSNCQCQLA
ncbi:MAG: hypothetical protein R3E68_07350 [Burkholderiaceae bacterium]